MKDSMVMEIATNELTAAVDAISHKYNINPSLLRFILSAVSAKVNELALQESINEVAELEIKIAEIQSKSENNGTSVNVEEKKAEPDKVVIAPKSRSVQKSGSIEDLIKDLKASGVNVTETNVESKRGNADDNTDSDNKSDTE